MYRTRHYTGLLIQGSRPVFFIQQMSFHGTKEHVFFEWVKRENLEENITYSTVAIWKIKRKEVADA